MRVLVDRRGVSRRGRSRDRRSTRCLPARTSRSSGRWLPAGTRSISSISFCADVADPEIAGFPVEAEAPRVAESPDEGLRDEAGIVDEGVVRRDAIGFLIAADVDAQDLGKKNAGILGIAVRIALAAAVAEAQIEETIRSENNMAAVVIPIRLVEREDRDRRVRIELVRLVSAGGIAHDLGIALDIGVGNEDAAVLGKSGIERHAEQALLVPGRYLIG